MNEIIASDGRTPPGPPGGAEPRLTLSEVRALLAEAAAYERARSPVVIHGVHEVAQPPASTQAAPPGASVYLPMPPSTPPYATVLPSRPEKRSYWPLVFVTSMCGVISAGYACAATGSSAAVIAVTGFAGTWGLATYRLVFASDRA